MWIKKGLIFAIFAAAALATSVENEDSVENNVPDVGTYGMEDLVTQIIEGLRNQLKQGIPEKNIPPLDPLDMKHQVIDIKFKELTFGGLLSNVTGNNLLSFKVSKLKASPMPISFQIRLDWEPIDVKGLYDIDGNLLGIIPIYGNGTFGGVFNGVFGYLRLDIGTKAGQLRVKKFDVDFGLKNINVNITNFLGGTLGDVICEMINENLPTMIEQFKIGYLESIKDIIMNVVNDFIKDKSMEELLDMLLGMFTTTTTPAPTTTARSWIADF
ncbi:UNVERIFIED_CONTAM: hypothetical protein PYX00_002342 [Menopon gallinae]|uniref:Uncharacterized protein n=1 Tax=Menopon gallinae TaxID=328185 RepID=A0AAW2IGC9_9NEOP